MEIKGTREAFIALIHERGINKQLEVSPATVRGWRKRVTEGALISLDKMEEMLLKAGASVVHEKVWEVKIMEER